ncbi:hypothetical protein H9Q69_000099 [Fusarium xylarioides]|nr:hypothetical protein H9Q69_000099 [Fusarium xylarioides]
MVIYEDISTWLCAVSANSSPDGQGNNLITHQDDTLFMQQHNATGDSQKFAIAANVKGSAALISDKKLFAVDADDTLRYFVRTSGNDSTTWLEEGLGTGNIKVHPKSQLCVLEDGLQTAIFYQDVNNILAVLQGSGNEWKKLPLSASDCQIGTPMAFFPFNGRDYLFYISKNERVHRLFRDTQDAEWKDEQFSAAKLEDIVSKIVVIPSEEEGQITLNLFGLRGNKLVLVTESSAEPTVLGMVRDGEFILGRCAIASTLIGCLIGKVVGAAGGGGNAAGGCCLGAGSKTYTNYEFALFQGVHNQKFN